MFYYQITTTKTTQRGGDQVTRRHTEYREFLRPDDLGAHVAHLVGDRPRSVVVKPINQATFIRRTRKD